MPILVSIALLAFIPYFVAVWRPPKLPWIIAVAVLARLAMWPVPPVLSNDVYRYAWDGRVLQAGHDPYRLAPDAPELAGLRDANWERLDHREVPTVYPPLLLQVFRAGDHFKLIFTGFDLATLWMLVKLLRARGQRESLAVIWAWNPLVILEFAGNGHAMSMAIFFAVAALWLWETNRRVLSGAAWACAALSHFLAWPVALAALAARREYRAGLVFAVVIAIAFAIWPVGLLGLAHLAGRWRFNGSLFEVLVWLFGGDEARQVGGVWVTQELPKRIAAGLLAAVMAWTVVKRYRPSRAAFTVAGAVLLLSSTVHPWYVTWMVALACVEFRVPWLALSGFVVVSYVARVVELETGVWAEAGIVRWMEYAPFFALWLVDSVRRRQ